MTFYDLAIGTVFEACDSKIQFIKLSHCPEKMTSRQVRMSLPNSYRLDNRHYCVCPPKLEVKIVKQITDYPGGTEYED